MDRDYWIEELAAVEIKLDFSDGYRFVYGPWETLDKAEVAFLSLNPGRGETLDKETMRDISDERGNTYEVEQGTSASPMVDQFLRLAKLIEHRPADILTGVVVPFRSKNWDCVEEYQREESLALGRRFWKVPLSRPDLRLIIVTGTPTEKLVVDITEASCDGESDSGWGSYKLRRYRLPKGGRIVYLPHLSHFRLFGRKPSEPKVREFLDDAWDASFRP